jgi:hypothetical protein
MHSPLELAAVQVNPSSIPYRTESWLLVELTASEKTANEAPARPRQLRIKPVSMGRQSRPKPLASISTRNDRRTAPIALRAGKGETARRVLDAVRSFQDRIIGLRIQPGLRRVARPGVRPPPAASLDLRQRSGRTSDACGVSPAGYAKSRR